MRVAVQAWASRAPLHQQPRSRTVSFAPAARAIRPCGCAWPRTDPRF